VNSVVQKDVYIFDTETLKWRKPNVSYQNVEEKFCLCFHSAALVGNSILICGGNNDVPKYNPLYTLNLGKDVERLPA
jgi:hypothetical protein